MAEHERGTVSELGHEQEPRRWKLLVCPCGTVSGSGSQCSGFPGEWDEDRSDFKRGSCLGEYVEVVEVRDEG